MPRTKNAHTRTAILAAAARAFDAREFHAVHTDDIAARAGVGKATLFRYFPTKEDLFFATLVAGFDELDAAMDAARGAGTSRTRLEWAASEILRVFWGRPSFYTLLHRSDSSFRSKERLLERRRARVLAAVRAILEEGARRGELTVSDVPLAAELFLGLVRAALYRRRPTDAPAHLVKAITSVFLHGVAA